MPEGSLLVIEDDVEMAAVLRQGFEQTGFAVQVARDGQEGLSSARQRRFHIIVLDLLLPVMDGYSVARALRQDGDRTPILMLTARDTISDIVFGFDCGADDYLTKPFSFAELSVRVRALVRRAEPPVDRLATGGLSLDVSTHQVMRGAREIRLSKTEFRILEILMRHKGNVVRRRDLVREVWGENVNVEENTVDVSMSSLRSKLHSRTEPRLIYTVRGLGYRLDAGE